MGKIRKVICVTGCVGSGKTYVAKRLAKLLGFVYVDCGSIIKREKLYSGYDKLVRTYDVEEETFIGYFFDLIQNVDEGLILDSHLSHLLPDWIVDYCIVTSSDLKVLKKRLKDRGYSKLKIKENVECELFESCYVDSLELGHNVIKLVTPIGVDVLKDLALSLERDFDVK